MASLDHASAFTSIGIVSVHVNASTSQKTRSKRGPTIMKEIICLRRKGDRLLESNNFSIFTIYIYLSGEPIYFIIFIRTGGGIEFLVVY